jgi:hypothetical protein
MGIQLAMNLYFRGHAMAEKACPCLFVADDGETCIDCGQHIEIPDVEVPDLGDITGIIRLIDSMAKIYAQRIKDNTDPDNPSLPRLSMVGGQFLRIPHKLLYKDLLEPSYVEAKRLGYRGTITRWGEIVLEAAPSTASQL